MLVDQYGRTRLFRGVNVVYKAPPWHPATDRFDASTSFVEKDAEILAQLGINAIRLAIHWAGAEPERGSFNQTYFDVMRTIIRTCARHGIYVLLEFHQDVLAQQFCGHGLPSWMIKIYANHDGMLDRFAEYWMRVATEYKDEPNLLGYEIMNEPWPGNHWRNPFLLLPGIASQTTLFNMHKRVAAAIRSVDPQAIIYFEGATWDIHNRAPTVPGGPNYANRSVLSYHYYRPPAIGSVRDTFRRRQQDAQRLGSGLFMTEFEMWWGPGNASETGALARMRETVEAADEYLQNWMGWSYKSFAQAPNSTDASLFDEATGEQRPEMARLLSRPFVSAAQGNISAMRFDEAAGVFSVTLDRREPPAGSGGDGGGSGGAVADLEISTARSTWFGGGLRVSVEPRGRSSWSFDALRQRVSVRAQAGVRRVNVTVSAA
ncbi:hypothetical protein HK105_200153 [Polyrhizophydium stewartii]|uniref:Glycoside hydrolase family 5 domain-containing protein n=1 Tax=Polyrhizophydium stewartii TaxID=2732419 RepID=A0ABR4NKN5_9FUNG